MQDPSKGGFARLVRQSRRKELEGFFLEHLEEQIPSPDLHWKFGSGVRTRISEINRDSHCRIRIHNETTSGRDERGQPCERSVYRAELRPGSSNPAPATAPRPSLRRPTTLPLFATAEMSE